MRGALYWVGLAGRWLAEYETVRLLKENVTEPIITEWVSLFIFPDIGQLALKLCWWQTPSHCSHQRLLFTSLNLWVLQMAGESTHLLNYWWKLHLLASGSWQTWPRSDRLYQSSRLIPVLTDAIWTGKHAYHLANGGGHYVSLCEVAAGRYIYRTPSRLLEKRWITTHSSSTCIDATALCRGSS